MISDYKKMLEAYSGRTQTPDDFAAHWKQRMAEAVGTIEMEPVSFCNPAAVYEKMTVTTGERKVFARCIRPAGVEKSPLVLMFHDLNRGIRGWHHMTRFIAQGYAVVALDAAVCKADWKRQPEAVDFESRYVDALILANAALSMRWVNGEKIVTWGEGFGAGLAMVAAAMLPGDVKCAALNPMPADIRGVCKEMEEETARALEYVDVVNFAPMIRGSVLMGVCLMDDVAPPEGQYAAYNRLTCGKEMKVYPKYIHERVNFFENVVVKFLHD